MQPWLKSRRDFAKNSCAGVSCMYTLELFGKINFTRPSEFFRTWHLPNVQFPRPELREHVARHCSRRDDILAVVHHLESLFSQVVGIASDVPEEFSFGDGIGNIPVWPENYVLHGVAKYRGIVVIGFAHNDVSRQRDLVCFVVRAEAKFGDVRDDGRRVEGNGQPPPAFERQLHLASSTAERNTKIGQGLGGDSSIRGSAMPALKTLDSVHQWSLVDCSIGGNARVGLEIAHQPEQFAQLRDARIGVARCYRFLYGGKLIPIIFLRKL